MSRVERRFYERATAMFEWFAPNAFADAEIPARRHPVRTRVWPRGSAPSEGPTRLHERTCEMYAGALAQFLQWAESERKWIL